MPSKVTNVRVKRFLRDKEGVTWGEISADVTPDDGSPDQAAVAGMTFLDGLARLGGIPVKPPSEANGAAGTASSFEFIDKATGETFDLMSDDRFKVALGVVYRARKFDIHGITAATAYIIGRAKVDRVAALTGPSRLSFLNELSSGTLDYLNQKNAGQTGGKGSIQ